LVIVEGEFIIKRHCGEPSKIFIAKQNAPATQQSHVNTSLRGEPSKVFIAKTNTPGDVAISSLVAGLRVRHCEEPSKIFIAKQNAPGDVAIS
jgi:hypothetical protein